MTAAVTRIHAVDRDGERHELLADPERSLMELLRDEGLGVEAVCGGCCSCATCHVHIDGAWQSRVGPPGEIEAELLQISAYFDADSSRPSCQIQCASELDGLIVTVAPEE